MKEAEFKKLMKATLGDLLLYGEEECDKHFDPIMNNNKKHDLPLSDPGRSSHR